MSARYGLPLAGLLALALAVRLLAQRDVADAPDTFAPIVDAEAYLLQALRVPAGDDIVEGVYFQAPLYPWLLGGLLTIADVPGVAAAERLDQVPADTVARALFLARAFNVACGVLLVLVVVLAGRELYSERAGLCAGLLVALHGPLLFFEGQALKESLAVLVLPTALLLAARALHRDRTRAFLGVGLVLGLGALVRGNVHLVSAAGASLLLLAAWRGRRGALASATWLVLGVTLALLPVVVRNSREAGQLVVRTAAGGAAFYMTNHAGNTTGLVEALPLNRQVPRHEVEDWVAETRRRTGRTLSPAELSSYWFAEACRQIAADPGRWLLAEARKLGLLFSRYEAPDMTHWPLAREVSPVMRRAPGSHALLVALACGAAALLAWRRGAPVPGRCALLLATLVTAAGLLLFVVSSRYRLPLAPLLALPAGWLLAELVAVARGRPAEKVVVLAGVGLGTLLTFVSEGPLGPLDARETTGHMAAALKNRAQVALARGDGEGARRDLERAVTLARSVGRDAPSVHVQLAQVALAAGRRDEARRELDVALDLVPRDNEALRLAGLIAYEDGDDTRAASLLEGALLALPGDRTARQYLALARLNLGDLAAVEQHARELVGQRPDDDDGHALLALALLRSDRQAEARAAVAEYDRCAAAREALGLPRLLGDQPGFAALRGGSP